MISSLLNRVHILEDLEKEINKFYGYNYNIQFNDNIHDILDSLEFLELIIECEHKYNYTSENENYSEYDDVKTFGDLIDIIIKYGRD